VGSEYVRPFPLAAPDVVLGGAVAKLESLILAVDAGAVPADLGMTLRVVMMTVWIQAQRLRDEGWQARSGLEP
jgi:hypothetical protein